MRLVGGGERRAHAPGDFACDLALQVQHAPQWPLILFAPEVVIIEPIEQLYGHAHLIAVADYRPFDDAIGVEFSGDLLQMLAAMRVCHDRGAGEHLQRLHARDLGNELVGQTDREVVLRRVAGEILERQYRDRVAQ